MTFDPDVLVDILDIGGPGRVAVATSIAQRPDLHLSTAQASTLTVRCADPDHEIPAQAAGLTAAAGDRTWSLVAIRRINTTTTLVFHDDITRALRTDHGDLSVPAGSTTVNELAVRMTRPRGVDVLLEPTRQTLTDAFVRTDSTWAALDVLAERTGRWRFTDTQQLVLASPGWLLTRDSAATFTEDEDTGRIDLYDLHANKPLETARATLFDVDTTPQLGAVHTLDVPGPAGGDWLVSEWVSLLGESSGRITWHRPQTTTWE